jgi:hypothetical protein
MTKICGAIRSGKWRNKGQEEFRTTSNGGDTSTSFDIASRIACCI